MNAMFGIDVRKQLFPPAKRKRAATQPFDHGGMLANLVSDDDTNRKNRKKGIRAASKKRNQERATSALSSLCVGNSPAPKKATSVLSNLCVGNSSAPENSTSVLSSLCVGNAPAPSNAKSNTQIAPDQPRESVLANIGNLQSSSLQPRRNKERKETKSSVLEDSCATDRHGTRMSIFELICKKPSDRALATSVTPGRNNARNQRRAKRRKKNRRGSKPTTQSVLAMRPENNDEDKENRPRREKRARRGSKESLRGTKKVQPSQRKSDYSASSEVWYDCVENEPKLCIALKSKTDVRPKTGTVTVLEKLSEQSGVILVHNRESDHRNKKSITRSSKKRERAEVVSSATQAVNIEEVAMMKSNEQQEVNNKRRSSKKREVAEAASSAVEVMKVDNVALMESSEQQEVEPTEGLKVIRSKPKPTTRSSKKRERDELARKMLQVVNLEETTRHTKGDLTRLDGPGNKTLEIGNLKEAEKKKTSPKEIRFNGPGARVLEVEMLNVVSNMEEAAALMLIQLSSGSKDDDEAHQTEQQAPIIQSAEAVKHEQEINEAPVAIKRRRKKLTVRDEEVVITKRVKRKRSCHVDDAVHVATKRIKTTHLASETASQPTRRSRRQAVPIQRYTPAVEPRKSKRRNQHDAKNDGQTELQSIKEEKTGVVRRSRRVSGNEFPPDDSKSSAPDVGKEQAIETLKSTEKSSSSRRSSRGKIQASYDSPHKQTDVAEEDDFFEDREELESLKLRKCISPAKKRTAKDVNEEASREAEAAPLKFNGGVKPNNKSKPLKRVQIQADNIPDEDGWTESQIVSLRNAYISADPRSTDFWEEISGQVKEMDEERCRKKWFALVMTPLAKKKAREKALIKRNKGNLAAGGEEDDLFNATPMRSQLCDDDANGYGNIIVDIDVGSPIVDGGIAGGAETMKTEYDDGIERDAAPNVRVGYKTYIKNLKKGITKAEKDNRKKKKKANDNGGPRVLSDSIDHGDLEVKGSLTPGGTVRLRTVDWNESEDDFFESDDEEE